MITLQLRELEADGVIARHVFAEVPPRVEYEVTEFGRSLEPILTLMQEWGGAFKARRLAEGAGNGTIRERRLISLPAHFSHDHDTGAECSASSRSMKVVSRA